MYTEEQKGQVQPTVLYHYTSLQVLHALISGMKSIKSSEREEQYLTFRATHIDYLNDLTEGVILPRALERMGYNINMLAGYSTLEGYPFIISLSSLYDDLNMWRCYADNAKGVCIGLAVDKLPKIKPVPCIYTNEEKLFEYIKDAFSELNPQNLEITVLSRILTSLAEYKDESFSAEKEWRLILKGFPSDVRCTGDILVPFYNYEIPIDAIESITFGPKCDGALNEFGANRLFMAKGFPYLERISFVQSQLPLN